MARQLYDYWFVQFDFPDENGRPYKSSGGKMVWNEKLKRELPEGWEVISLPNIATFTNGLACQKFRPSSPTHKLPVIKIREMRDGITAESEWVTSDIPEAVKVYDGDILFSWSASLDVMIWTGGVGGLNQHIFKVEPKSSYPKAFVYIQILDYISVFKGIAEARKTTMGHITQDHLNQSQIVVPNSKAILNAFEKVVSPIMDQYVKTSQESRIFIKQRDELLPLLMNGQVSVMPPEVNCDLHTILNIISITCKEDGFPRTFNTTFSLAPFLPTFTDN
ncbi:MAG: restriction endonuclease subunit S [Bacteroides sp.]|nr:restriction endonuclease subunit S [Bacteroides sp.]